MIDFEKTDSPFFERNKEHVEQVMKDLSDWKFNGWCNEYGFDVTATNSIRGLDYVIELKKHQTTQNGVILPVNSHVNVETNIEVRNLPEVFSYQFGLTIFEKLAEFKLSKRNSANDEYDAVTDGIKRIISDFSIKKLVVHKGRLLIKCMNDHQGLNMLISELVELNKKWP